MKNYTITVNGTPYNVTVEEGAAATASAPAAAPAPVQQAAPAPAKTAAPAEGTSVDAPMPGNILEVKAANGAAVKSGDVLVILEAMKMENEIVAPVDGVITFVASKGASVNTDDLLAVIA